MNRYAGLRDKNQPDKPEELWTISDFRVRNNITWLGVTSTSITDTVPQRTVRE